MLEKSAQLRILMEEWSVENMALQLIGPVLLILGQITIGLGALATGFAGAMGLVARFTGVLASLAGGWNVVMLAMRGILALIGAMLSWPVALGAAFGVLVAVMAQHWERHRRDHLERAGGRAGRGTVGGRRDPGLVRFDLRLDRRQGRGRARLGSREARGDQGADAERLLGRRRGLGARRARLRRRRPCPRARQRHQRQHPRPAQHRRVRHQG